MKYKCEQRVSQQARLESRDKQSKGRWGQPVPITEIINQSSNIFI
jgi:hypothetical protein